MADKSVLGEFEHHVLLTALRLGQEAVLVLPEPHVQAVHDPHGLQVVADLHPHPLEICPDLLAVPHLGLGHPRPRKD